MSQSKKTPASPKHRHSDPSPKELSKAEHPLMLAYGVVRETDLAVLRHLTTSCVMANRVSDALGKEVPVGAMPEEVLNWTISKQHAVLECAICNNKLNKYFNACVEKYCAEDTQLN